MALVKNKKGPHCCRPLKEVEDIGVEPMTSNMPC